MDRSTGNTPLLAVTLQRHHLGDRLWPQEWNGLAPFDGSAAPILHHLVDAGYLDDDSGLLHIGPEAEKRFGRRHFLELTAAFTAPPQFTVLAGRHEIGHADTSVLTDNRPGPRLLLLAGRSWRVTYIDWNRKRVFVEPADSGGIAKWSGLGLRGLSFELTRAIRDVLLGMDPPVLLTKRAVTNLGKQRQDNEAATGQPHTTVITREDGTVRWWTWAGYRANATLAATLTDVVDPAHRPSDFSLRLRPDLAPDMWHAAVSAAGGEPQLALPAVNKRAISGLKFSEVLPEKLAAATVAERLADFAAAAMVLTERVQFYFSD